MASTRYRLGQWHALKTFPDLVWIRIIRYLTDFSDQVNLVGASSHLQRLVAEVYPSYESKVVFHLLTRYVDTKDFRKLRLVCSGWNEIAITHLDDAHWDFDWQRNSKDAVHFEHSLTFERWSRDMDPTLISPSACRSFVLDPRSYTHPHEYYSLAMQHLAAYGHHTWNLKIHFPRRTFGCRWRITRIWGNTTDIIWHLKFVQDCLKHVPNLKSLYIPVQVTNFFVIVYPKRYLDHQQIKNWIKDHPFPILPNLTHFYTPQFENIFTKEILKPYKPQVQMLSISLGSTVGSWIRQNPAVSGVNDISCLTRMNYWLVFNNIHERVVQKMCKQNLTQLKVDFVSLQLPEEHEQKHVFGMWKSLLRILKLLRKGLQILSIKVPCTSDGSRPSVKELKKVTMTKLKRFEIEAVGLNWFEFLIKFAPNLEHFSLMPNRERDFEWVDLFEEHGLPRWNEKHLVNLDTMIIHGITYRRVTNDDGSVSYHRM